MKTLLSGMCAAALGATFAVTSVAPLNAAPIFVPKAQTAQPDVIQVQDGMRWRKRNSRKGGNVNENWRGNNFRRDGNYAWYNGKRGYRYKRAGYRYYNGFWFPAGTFIAGAVIGGAIANSNNYSGGSAHVAWCRDHYRSYRERDNTFQPNNGPRRQCNSPYS